VIYGYALRAFHSSRLVILPPACEGTVFISALLPPQHLEVAPSGSSDSEIFGDNHLLWEELTRTLLQSLVKWGLVPPEKCPAASRPGIYVRDEDPISDDESDAGLAWGLSASDNAQQNAEFTWTGSTETVTTSAGTAKSSTPSNQDDIIDVHPTIHTDTLVGIVSRDAALSAERRLARSRYLKEKVEGPTSFKKARR